MRACMFKCVRACARASRCARASSSKRCRDAYPYAQNTLHDEHGALEINTVCAMRGLNFISISEFMRVTCGLNGDTGVSLVALGSPAGGIEPPRRCKELTGFLPAGRSVRHVQTRLWHHVTAKKSYSRITSARYFLTASYITRASVQSIPADRPGRKFPDGASGMPLDCCRTHRNTKRPPARMACGNRAAAYAIFCRPGRHSAAVSFK